MKKIYVAGPYTSDTARGTQLNVNKAIEVGCKLIKKGYVPYIPHLCHYIWLNPCGNFEYDTWTKLGIEWLSICDCFYMIAESPGANKELEFAQKLGIPIFTRLVDVPNYTDI